MARLLPLMLWACLVLAGLGVGAGLDYLAAKDTLQREGATLHRIISQRVEQHDAHLTSLAAVLASSPAGSATFRAVSEAMRRFYPRILAVEAPDFGDAAAAEAAIARMPGAFDAAGLERRLAELVPGQAAAVPGRGGIYALVKRLPAGQGPRRGLVLAIDAGLLAEPEGGLRGDVRLALRDETGATLVERGAAPERAGILPDLSFEKALASRSQPLVVVLGRRPALAELLPAGLLIGWPVAAGVAMLLLAVLLRERRTSRRAREISRLHQHEARLAHAMRVNAMGEMASGIAHEITQPLTAILGQSQAGLRLARAPQTATADLVGVLEANVRHARRAADIVERLRAYVSPRAPERRPSDLNDIVRNVVALCRRDLDQRGIRIRLDLAPLPLPAMVDRVSIEQVVHNLVRNAAEALEGTAPERREIAIATFAEGAEVGIAVADEGPGIAEADVGRLFEPFFSTKRDGMGLGLPLCERLVEAAGGRIQVRNGPARGAVATVRLPALAAEVRMAAE